jgi:branched-chain amino acid transport system substrate-binding protein
VGKLVIFEIGEGSFDSGFPLKLKIAEEGKPNSVEISGRLPATSEIPQQYYDWQTVYCSLQANWLIIIPQTQITHFSSKEACESAAQTFQKSFNQWLNQPSVRQLEWQLLQQVGQSEKVRFILQTQDSLLRRLPWHLWDFFQTCYPQAEIAVSTEYEPSRKRLKAPVKILAILGDSQGINIQEDLHFLEKLPGAKIKLLQEPSRQEITDKLWNQSWDILFFAGHSQSQEGDSWGEIKINRNESLSLLTLHRSLRNAVKKGLKLAIFNSCDGLGLARNLADLQIPYTIVMREPVPDRVAQHFLQYFLTAFARGESFYLSVQQARQRLQEELEDKYPCASWLPVIFQNPAAAELKYPKVYNYNKIALIASMGMLSIGSIGALSWSIVDKIQFNNRFSSGEKILINSVSTTEKKHGVLALANSDYQQAISRFESSLQQKKNDPETLIYLNNAKIGKQPALNVGVAVPIGSNPIVAQEILRGVAQAQREVNNLGGINGKPLKIEIANDGNNPEIAKRIAQKFVQDANILAVVGHNSSDASVAASYIYQRGKLVMISPTSTSRSLTERTDSSDGNYIFRSVISVTPIAEALAQYVKTVGKSHIAICRDSQATEQSFESEFYAAIAKNGGQRVDIDCDFARQNFQPEDTIKRAIATGADSIILNPHVDRTNKAIAVAQANQGKLTLLGNPSIQSSKTLEQGASVRGMVIAVPWHAVVSPDKKFTQNSRNLWGDMDTVSWRTATAFDATSSIAMALKQKDTRNGVQQVFSHGFSFPGATGEVKFSYSGERSGSAVLVQVKNEIKTPNIYRFVPTDSIYSRISLGDKLLVTDKSNANKISGIQGFGEGNYDRAIASFQASLQNTPNDPETRIYLQNALAIRSGKSLKLAVSVPIGSNVNIAKEILQGVAQAQDEVNNRGGIRGHLLQVEIASDDNNPEISKQLAALFIEDSQILAVVGHNASDASVAACPIYEQGKLVSISPTSYSLKLAGCGSYIFRTAPNIRFIANTLSHYAINTANTKNLVICVDEKAIDNQSFRDEFTAAIFASKGKIINIPCNFSASDFNPNQMITDTINNGAEGLVLGPYIDRINTALELAKANKGRLRLFGSPTLNTSQTLQQGQADVTGMVLAVPWDSKADFGNQFGKTSEKLWGSPVTWRSATAYDATVAIISSLRQAKTREQVQEILRSPGFSVMGATGKVEFLQSGDRNLRDDAKLVKIQPSSTSPTGYEFFPLN